MTYILFQTFHVQLSLIINRFDIMNSVRRHYWLWWMNNLRRCRLQISKSLYSTFYLSIINAESSVLVVCTGLGTVKIDLKLIMNENKLSQHDLGTLCLESLHPQIFDFACVNVNEYLQRQAYQYQLERPCRPPSNKWTIGIFS